MAYTKTVWVNDTSPAINETNLNKIEQGIYDNAEDIGDITDLETTATNLVDAINEVGGSISPTGAINMFAGSTAPSGWLICDGSAISRTDYADLFSIIGTTYGTGDGSTTFNLPNLKGRVPVGQDTSQTEFDTLGETGGSKTHTLTTNQIPSHQHRGLLYNNQIGLTMNDGSHNAYRLQYVAAQDYRGATDYQAIYTGAAGGGQPHNILQPYMVLNYIIKT